MTFDALEISNYDAIPVALYEFTLGASGNKWHYVSGEQDVNFGGFVYEATAISDSGIIQSGDVQNDDYTVTMPASSPFASLFIGTPPSVEIFLVVRSLNRGDPEAPIVWVGQVRSTKRVNLVTLEVVCKTLTASLNRNGLRLAWGRGCPHALYDRNCKVLPSNHGVVVQIQGLTGASIISSGLNLLPAKFLDGGYFEWAIMPGVSEKRMIESCVGPVVNVLGTTDGLLVGMWLALYPGCDRTTPTCQNKFNNLANYGGFPHMPNKSPFDGDPVF